MNMWRRKVAVFDESGIATVVDVTTLQDYDPYPLYGCEEPREHYGCGGTVKNESDYVTGDDCEEYWWDYRCDKCGETFREPREWMFNE